MTPARAPNAPRPARRVSGKLILLLMLIAVALLTAGLYTVLTRLKIGGAEALKSRHEPAPTAPADPAQPR